MNSLFTHILENSDLDAKTVSDFLVNKRYGTKLPGSVKDAVKIIKSLKTPVAADQSHLEETIKKVVTANPKAVSDYQSGKEPALFFLIGCVRRELGNVDISTIKDQLTGLLKPK